MAAKKLWSEEELLILEEWYPKEGIRVEGPDTAKRLAGRSKESVRIHAQKLGVRRG